MAPLILAQTSEPTADSWALRIVLVIGGALLGWLLEVLRVWMSERRLFDHRLRLEKEYGLYWDLWKNLFELRGALGQLVSDIGTSNAVDRAKDAPKLYNEYKDTVRYGEPFLDASVFDPAREIDTLARKILDNMRTRQSIEERRATESSNDAQEKSANKLTQLDSESEAAFEEIEPLFRDVSAAIRKRVTP